MAEIQNGDITSSPKLSIEAILSVVPHRPTDPRVPRKIMVENNNVMSCGFFQRRFHMIFYYNKSLEDNSGWLVVGRMKESLGEVLSAQPLFAGRVRRVEGGGGGGELELVPNDSGVRFVKTKMSTTLEELLNLKGEKDMETKLLHWEDIDAQNPQFSPLLYVQVTDFYCGMGYSIGISCSLLLADPLALANFLTSWTKIHNKMFSGLKHHDKPLFYNPILEPNLMTPFYSNSDPSTRTCKSLIFEFASKDLTMDSETQKAIAMQCIAEAEHESSHKMSSENFSLLMKVRSSSDDIMVKVENFVKSKLVAELSELVMKIGDGDGIRRRIDWDYLQLDGISFEEGKQPVDVSCWINTLVDEGMVVVVISSPVEVKSGINNIVVVVQNE